MKEISMKAVEESIKNNLAMADAIIKATADEKNATIITSDFDLKKIGTLLT